MLSIEERLHLAEAHCREAEHRQRVQRRQEREAQKKLNQRQNYLIGELVIRHFSELRNITPGTAEENAERFAALDALLRQLAASPDFISTLTAAQNITDDDPSGSDT